MASVNYRLGNHDRAHGYLDTGLPIFRAVGDLSALVLFLYLAVALMIEGGKEEQGAQMYGAVEMLRTRTGADIANVEANVYDPVTALDNDPRPEIQEAIARGRGMSVDEAMAITFSG